MLPQPLALPATILVMRQLPVIGRNMVDAKAPLRPLADVRFPTDAYLELLERPTDDVQDELYLLAEAAKVAWVRRRD